MKTFKKLNVGIVTFPYRPGASTIFLSHFIQVLEPLSNELFVVTGNFNDTVGTNVHIINVKWREYKTILGGIFKSLLTDLDIAIQLFRVCREIDVLFFYLGGAIFVFPTVMARLTGRKIIQVIPGSASESVKQTQPGIRGEIISKIYCILEHFNYMSAKQIVVYSPRIIYSFGIERYKNKIFIGYRGFVNTKLFKVNKVLAEREGDLVGYFGRLAGEKGILNLIQAIPLVLKKNDNVRFLIGGNGPLLSKIIEELKRSECYDKVNLTGWIPHGELPRYLNELKLLVLPSYTEGLPAVMLEAMACGTSVLATPVGAIPDIIKNGETGYIMEDNSPECIAQNILRIFEHPHLGQLIENARTLVEERYTYEAAVESYRKIL